MEHTSELSRRSRNNMCFISEIKEYLCAIVRQETYITHVLLTLTLYQHRQLLSLAVLDGLSMTIKVFHFTRQAVHSTSVCTREIFIARRCTAVRVEVERIHDVLCGVKGDREARQGHHHDPSACDGSWAPHARWWEPSRAGLTGPDLTWSYLSREED